jgi:hypothetical protein
MDFLVYSVVAQEILYILVFKQQMKSLLLPAQFSKVAFINQRKFWMYFLCVKLNQINRLIVFESMKRVDDLQALTCSKSLQCSFEVAGYIYVCK